MAALGLMVVASASPSHAQIVPPSLNPTDTFGVLAGASVTNVPPSIITGTATFPGNVGAVSSLPATPISTNPGVTEVLNNALTVSALSTLGSAITYLNNLPAGVNLTGHDLGGLTLIPGVYNFSSSAQLTGNLTLNALGDPNAVFVVNIGSTLTTASASKIILINGAQGGNVFWNVGSSATLGTTTSFAGDILAKASITLDTSAIITCGAAWAKVGSVTLDHNTISLCDFTTGGGGGGGGGGGPVIGPTGFPLLTSLLPSSTSTTDISIATAIDTFVSGGGTLPLALLNLFTLTPSQLATALTQLSGEAATGAQESGFQMTNLFLSLLTNPFAENRGFAPAPPSQPPLIYKTLALKAPAQAAPEPRRWSIWGAAYGGAAHVSGDPTGVGSNDLSTREGGFATGLDYLVTPDTLVGFALAGGGTSWSLAAGLGGGRADVLQAGLYAAQRYGEAYLSGALTYASYWAHTSRTVTVAADTLNASLIAQNFGGRLEGGYRVSWWAPFSVIPYAAVQAQSFRTPGYSESGSSGAPDPFALTYNGQTATVVRSELGSRFDQVIPQADRSSVVLFGRAAWAHDWQSNPNLTATFLGLPGAAFVVNGAVPPKDLALATAGAEWRWTNGWSVMAKLDGEYANGYNAYAGTARVTYSW